MILPSKEFLDIFKSINGALSCAEAIAIMNIANIAPEGTALELGTHRGKSAISALYGFSENMIFYLVDPDFEDKKVEHEVAVNVSLIAEAGRGKCASVMVNGFSESEIPKYGNYSYVFVDSGNHQDGLPMREVILLEDRIILDGIIAFHDFDSQFKEVREAYDYLMNTGKYEEIKIDWMAISEYVIDKNLENGNNSWHHTEMECPCFVGALKRTKTYE